MFKIPFHISLKSYKGLRIYPINPYSLFISHKFKSENTLFIKHTSNLKNIVNGTNF